MVGRLKIADIKSEQGNSAELITKTAPSVVPLADTASATITEKKDIIINVTKQPEMIQSVTGELICCLQGFLGINNDSHKNISTINTKIWTEAIFSPEGGKRNTDPSVVDSKATSRFYCSSEWGKVFKLFLPWSIQQRKVSVVTFNVWVETGGSKKLFASR